MRTRLDVQYTKKGLTKFIEDGKLIHNSKYSYDKTIYNGAHIKCIITCPIHGDFEQSPNSHTTKRNGCMKCGRDKVGKLQNIGIEEFIRRSREKHNNKFDYSLVNFISVNKKVKIICDKGHIFQQTPYEHYSGSGCPVCIGYYKSNLDIIKMFNETHNYRYSYDKVNYTLSKKYVIITCPTHGDFNQIPIDHSKGRGCPKCNTLGKVSEPKLFNKIKEHFDKYNIKSNVRLDWLGRKSLDIFIEEHNIAIEYQGIQHFKSSNFFGGENTFNEICNRDIIKNRLCVENDVKLFYFTYKSSHIPNNYFDKVYSSEEDLLNEIENYIKLKKTS